MDPGSLPGPFSVIAGLTISCADPRSGFFPSFLRKQESIFQESIFIGTRPAEGLPEAAKYLRRPSAVRNGPRIKSGVTDTEETRIRPASFRHCGFDHKLRRSAVRPFFRHFCESRAWPGLDPGNPCSSGRDGGSPSGMFQSRRHLLDQTGRHGDRRSADT